MFGKALPFLLTFMKDSKAVTEHTVDRQFDLSLMLCFFCLH
jgi:hypothetical protein